MPVDIKLSDEEFALLDKFALAALPSTIVLVESEISHDAAYDGDAMAANCAYDTALACVIRRRFMKKTYAEF